MEMNRTMPTDEEIAEMVRSEWNARPNEISGRGPYRVNRRIDHSVRAVAQRFGLDWRAVLRAYRAKYPLPPLEAAQEVVRRQRERALEIEGYRPPVRPR